MSKIQIFTVPFESDTSLQINGTSLFNWIVDAPNLKNEEFLMRNVLNTSLNEQFSIHFPYLSLIIWVE
jgi:hypothetical protein